MANSVIKKDVLKKSYTFNASTDALENCFSTDLLTSATMIIGIKVKDRAGWNFIARNGISGSNHAQYWALALIDGTLSGTYNFDVLYINV